MQASSHSHTVGGTVISLPTLPCQAIHGRMCCLPRPCQLRRYESHTKAKKNAKNATVPGNLPGWRCELQNRSCRLADNVRNNYACIRLLSMLITGPQRVLHRGRRPDFRSIGSHINSNQKNTSNDNERWHQDSPYEHGVA